VLVTYDQFGGYGHPDHVQAHRVAMYATQLAAVPSYRPDLGEPWDIAKVYWTAISLTRLREEAAILQERGVENPFDFFDLDDPPRFVARDEAIACEVDATEYADAKVDAMRAHASQIAQDGPFFAAIEHVGTARWGYEAYRIAKGTIGPVDERGLETDLFAGL
jgi:N-acetyl-1-D-myo-inositol-2-amino-2-deoxy-alpha-D-glucopyranoside deacetylase